MSEKKSDMIYFGTREKQDLYVYGAGLGEAISNEADGTADTATVYSGQDGSFVPKRTVIVKGKEYSYAMYGDDDQLPYLVRESIGDNMITAQSQLFNVQTCYGAGPRFADRKTGKKSEDADIAMWALRNDVNRLYLEMCVDMKFYYFCVVVFTLSRDGSQILRVTHRDACNCRFTTDLEYVLYGNFEAGAGTADEVIEVIPRLNPARPFDDLMERTGREASAGTGVRQDSKLRKFALVCSFPTVGQQYYPRQTFMSVFRDKWYDIYRLIGFGKREKIRNSSSPRFQIEIHRDYWDWICDQDGLTDEEARKARVKTEKENIERFVCGLKNAGKTWITGFYVDPNGKENSYVKITNLEQGTKEGGDWADDVQEASNMLCFSFNVHPNLIGATPGKTAMNNSGSDKRELFTLKQALDIAFREMMLPALRYPLFYNGWYKDVEVDVPIVQLTTLDEGTDAKKKNIGDDTNKEE